MSGIAEIIHSAGIPVTGSDAHESSTTRRLQKDGMTVHIGHQADNLRDATCVVVSTAISSSNIEVLTARSKGLPVMARAEMLAELMRLKRGVAVAGSHGKTTTTSMVGQFVSSLDPSVVVGGRLQHWNASSLSGQGDLFVIEADESDRSFLKFSPVYTIVTNIDREHLDVYRDLDDVKQTFLEFMNRTAFFGMNWICLDCPVLRSLKDDLSKPFSTYGQSADADLVIQNMTFTSEASRWNLSFRNEHLGEFEVPAVGKHIVLNATAAIGIGLSLGLSVMELKERARQFVAADRRLQVHFDDGRRAVVEDYGHHPTEIRVTLEALALKYPHRKLRVVFQPHRYSRTKALFHDFAPSFSGLAHEVFLLPIYAANESPVADISSQTLAKTFAQTPVVVLDDFPNESQMRQWAQDDNQVILILGAGPLSPVAAAMAAILGKST